MREDTIKSMENLSGPDLRVCTSDRVFLSIVCATQWLDAQKPSDLVGDDSVGWWMLLFSGKQLPSVIGHRMSVQLDKIFPTIEIGKSSLYTVTVILRTLMRTHQLEKPNKFIVRFRELIENSAFAKLLNAGSYAESIPLDIIWLLQALYELGGVPKQFAISPIESFIELVFRSDPIIISMLWPILKEIIYPTRLDELCDDFDKSKDKITSGEWLKKHLDWQVSYILLVFVDRGMSKEADLLAEYLMSRQKDCQWDEDTEENIESTSLVALSLSFYWKSKIKDQLAQNDDELLDNFVSYSVHRAMENRENIDDRWTALKNSAGKTEKGRLLEEFIAYYASLDSSHFRIESSRQRTKSEEIDLVLVNLEASDFYRQMQSRVILLECKYTSSKTDAKEVRNFWTKVQNRKRFLCRAGLIISMSGFTKDALIELLRLNSSDKNMIVSIVDGKKLEQAISESLPFHSLLEQAIIRIDRQ